VVRASETDFRLVECFEPLTNACTLSPSCRLRLLFQSGLQAFFAELDGATLADIVSAQPAPPGPPVPPVDAGPGRRAVIRLAAAPPPPLR